MNKEVIVACWAVDFVSALKERPLIMRLLFRLATGKYAYREFLGLVKELSDTGYYPGLDYNLKNMDYHNEPLPLDWVDSLYGEGRKHE